MANQPPHSPQAPASPQKKGMSTCLIVAIVLAVLAVPILGTMAALGIYGVRRYLAAAKTAEAKNTVGAIARAAVAAHERETLLGDKTVHRLCDSATPVPALVPAAKKYQPSTAAGADFHGGTATAGWKCLRFELSMPMYYQYHYQHGSGWVAPSNAPGESGFEAAAKGDLDGNGIHSTFSRTGRVVGDSVVVEPSIFVDNEFE